MRNLFLLIAFLLTAFVPVSGQTVVREVVNVTSDPSGATCARNRLYKNTVNNTLWQRNSVSGQCEQIEGGGGGGAPADATYITKTPNASLSAEQALSALSSGIMRVATTTGVVTSLTDSGGIAANVSDETGSGALVFGTSPNITTPTGIVKGDVGLANVDNTSDAAKPVSTAQQSALDLKANLASPTFTGTVVIPTPFTLGAVSVTPTGTELNFVDGVTSAIQTQIDGKQGTLTNSAGLAAALSDETGTGLSVFSTSPSLTTPAIDVATGTSLTVTGTVDAATLKAGSGSDITPSLGIGPDPDDYGFFWRSGTGVTSTYNSTDRWSTADEGIRLVAVRNLTWSSSSTDTGGSPDTGLSRNAAGVIETTNGTAGGLGKLLAARVVTAKTSGYTVLSADKSTFFTNTGAGAGVTFTLPTPVVGMTYEFYRDANQTVTIDIAAGVTIRVGASVTTDGGNATLDAVGSRLRIVAISTTQWVGDISGTVTFN